MMDLPPLYLDCFQDGGKVSSHSALTFRPAFELVCAHNIAIGTHDGRVGGPLVSRGDWDQKLRQAGFSRADICMPQVEEYARFSVILTSKASHILS